jgi:hypothetical protein
MSQQVTVIGNQGDGLIDTALNLLLGSDPGQDRYPAPRFRYVTRSRGVSRRHYE